MFANPTLFVAIEMMFFFCSIFSLFSHAIGFLVPSGLQRSFIGITYTFSENDSFATVGAVVTKNGSIFPIRGHDSNIVDAMLFTCCTLARLYMVRNCRKKPNRQRCGLGYWWVCVIKLFFSMWLTHYFSHNHFGFDGKKQFTVWAVFLVSFQLVFLVVRLNCCIVACSVYMYNTTLLETSTKKKSPRNIIKWCELTNGRFESAFHFNT